MPLQPKTPSPTAAVEDYAKAIYALSHDGRDPVSTTSLAERLGVTPASASDMKFTTSCANATSNISAAQGSDSAAPT